MSIYLTHQVMRDPAKVRYLAIVKGEVLYLFRLDHASMVKAVMTSSEPIHGCSMDINMVHSVWCWGTEECERMHAWSLESWDYEITPLSSGGRHGTTQAGFTLRKLEGGGNPCCVYDLSVDVWGFKHLMTAGLLVSDLAEALWLSMQLLGVQLRFSASYTGTIMLREELQRWPQDIPTLSEEWQEFFLDKMAHPMTWARPLLASDPQGAIMTIWSYDRNSSYVSSARDVPLGAPSRAYHLEAQNLSYHPLLLPKCPGLYCISATSPLSAESAEVRAYQPGIFLQDGTYPHVVSMVWAWEPQVRLAIARGWAVFCHEAYTWNDKHHDLFRSWQGRLWNARKALRRPWHGVVSEIADSIIKRVGVAGIGRLRQTVGRKVVRIAEVGDDEEVEWYGQDEQGQVITATVAVAPGRHDLYQPAWWSTIIANATERLQYALFGAVEDEKPCLGCWVDTVYLLQKYEALGGDKMVVGGWRAEGVVTVARESIPDTPGHLNKFIVAQKGSK